MKRDDCSLPPADLANVRRHAERLLRGAGANGRLPTPVADLVESARLEVARDVSLDPGFLTRLYRKITEPIRRAIDKVLGLLDRRDRTIYLDQTVHKNKEPFLCLHETGHDFLPCPRAGRRVKLLQPDGRALECIVVAESGQTPSVRNRFPHENFPDFRLPPEESHRRVEQGLLARHTCKFL